MNILRLLALLLFLAVGLVVGSLNSQRILLDFGLLEATRGRAQVANDRDWSGQHAPSLVRARVEGFEPL